MESPCVSPCSLIGPNLPSANQSGSKLTNKVLVRFISRGNGRRERNRLRALHSARACGLALLEAPRDDLCLRVPRRSGRLVVLFFLLWRERPRRCTRVVGVAGSFDRIACVRVLNPLCRLAYPVTQGKFEGRAVVGRGARFISPFQFSARSGSTAVVPCPYGAVNKCATPRGHVRILPHPPQRRAAHR